MSTFQTKFDDKLIDLVRQYSVIWDPSRKSCRDRVMRDNAWKEIALQVNRSDKDCRIRWRTIRDSYKKVKKITTGLGASESRSKYRRMDNLKFLDCITDARRSTKTTCEVPAIGVKIEQEEDDITEERELPHDDDTDGEVLENVSEASLQNDYRTIDSDMFDDNGKTEEQIDVSERVSNEKEDSLQSVDMSREEKTEISKALSSQDNHVHTFFRSMAQSVCSFPDHLIIETKLKVCQLIAEMEMKALAERANNRYTS